MAKTETETEHLFRVAREFKLAMLGTISEGKALRSKPMTVADLDPGEGAVWFVTSKDSGTLREIEKDARVVVTMQSNNAFIELSGEARAVDDRGRLAKLWSPSWSLWFPDGPEAATLICVDVEAGEYWDQRGTRLLQTLVKRAVNAVRGINPKEDADSPRTHAKVSL
jgi:general stress protein 26